MVRCIDATREKESRIWGIYPPYDSVVWLVIQIYKQASDRFAEEWVDHERDIEYKDRDHNFYEVWTPRNRIFTFQTEDFKDAKLAYEKLVEYFAATGGVKQVDLEITGNLVRKPFDFPLARVIPRGYFTRS